ncbi:MAG: response regulator [Desulfuromonadia bacterium]
MSLIGNLEDLCLGEILQIVNLSRKTGILTVRSEGRKAILCFNDGQVVQAMSTVFHRGVGELLIRRGAVDERTLLDAEEKARKDPKKPPIGVILVREHGVSPKVIEGAVREQIERVIFSLFSWTTGTFDFEPRPSMELSDDLRLDPVAYMIRIGMSPPFLVADDDSKRTPPPAPSAGSSHNLPSDDPTRAHVVIVDDDVVSRETMAEAVATAGFQPHPFPCSEDALAFIDPASRKGERIILVADLIMPRMDGAGILGGIELVEIIRNNYPRLPVLVVSDYHNVDAEKKIDSLSCSFLIKPRKSEFEHAEVLEYFVTHFALQLRRLAEDSATGNHAGRVDIGDELRREMGPESGLSPDGRQPTVGLTLLRSMLEELNEPSLGGGVILLILRFASEFMNRAVIFMVDDHSIFALGQFGVLPSNVMTADFVRELVIPRHEKTIFSDLLEQKIPLRVKPNLEGWNHLLYEKLRGIPYESFIAPVLREGKVVAILYGDNYPDPSRITDTEALEIFLSQAGMALEKALLANRLRRSREVS